MRNPVPLFPSLREATIVRIQLTAVACRDMIDRTRSGEIDIPEPVFRNHLAAYDGMLLDLIHVARPKYPGRLP